MRIKINGNRKALSEGRDYGMGFTYAVPISEEDYDYETVFAPTACKDFLNDTILADKVEKQFYIYGLTSGPEKKLDKGVCIVYSILEFNYSGKYSTYDKDVEAASDYEKTQRFLNFFEDELGIQRSIITNFDDNMYLVDMPDYWIQTPYQVSYFTMLLRISIHWDGEQDILEFIVREDIPDEKEYMKEQKLLKFFEELKKGELEWDLSVYEFRLEAVHDHGFIHYLTNVI